MKVKCINNNNLPWGENLTIGKKYEVLDEEFGHYVIINDNGMRVSYIKSHFLTPSLKTQLQEARDLVAALEKQIEEAAPKVKVGQKYKLERRGVYMVCSINGKFVLVNIQDDGYLGESYGACVDSIYDVFHGNNKFFTLLK